MSIFHISIQDTEVHIPQRLCPQRSTTANLRRHARERQASGSQRLYARVAAPLPCACPSLARVRAASSPLLRPAYLAGWLPSPHLWTVIIADEAECGQECAEYKRSGGCWGHSCRNKRNNGTRLLGGHPSTKKQA